MIFRTGLMLIVVVMGIYMLLLTVMHTPFTKNKDRARNFARHFARSLAVIAVVGIVMVCIFHFAEL